MSGATSFDADVAALAALLRRFDDGSAELLAVGHTLAVGVAHDGLGVERLRAYRLVGGR